MKIIKVDFKGHSVLGTLAFDFRDQDGNAVDNIIIAGENGCGKSLFLNEIFRLFSNYNNTPDGDFELELELTDDELLRLKTNSFFTQNINYQRVNLNELSHFIKISYESSRSPSHMAYALEVSDNIKKGSIPASPALAELKSLFCVIFSDVEINFTPKEITSITAQNIDEERSLSAIKTSTNIATEITQLLIDIDNLDNAALADWVEENPNEAPPDSVKKVRIKRFIDAFHYMFPYKKYIGVKNKLNKKKVLFEEHGREMSIDKLSSGEKQIVFRGGFLLKDKESIKGALALIDEPEISLHPSWQLKIPDFLKKLFTDESGKQTSQIIMTTHSPFIIHSERKVSEKVIILNKDDSGQITIPDEAKFYNFTSEEIVEKAFYVNYALKNDEVTVFVEGITDENYLNKALGLFSANAHNIKFNAIGSNSSNKSASNTGESALRKAIDFYNSNPNYIINKVVFLFDCDVKSIPESKHPEKLFILKMDENVDNNLYTKGIENLLTLPYGYNKEEFVSTKERKDDGYGNINIIKSLDKTKLCDAFCTKSDTELESVFTKLKLEIAKIEELLK